MKNRYRVVSDSYAGFEVQMRRWWFPVWLQCGCVNTHTTLNDALAYIARLKVHTEHKKVVYFTEE